MFVDRIGEIVHPEMPEDTPDQQPLFHWKNKSNIWILDHDK
jgi:hypothetical protein